MDGNGVSVVLCFTRLLILHLKKILLSKRVTVTHVFNPQKPQTIAIFWIHSYIQKCLFNVPNSRNFVLPKPYKLLVLSGN